MDALTELQRKLREIFQIDRADLDFGIYRILNSKAQEIEHYLSRKLPQAVKAAFDEASGAQTDTWRQELQQWGEALKDKGEPQERIKTYLEYRLRELQAQNQAAYDVGRRRERDIYNHLLTFFSRYYEEGDFISQRRYKGGTYAIPYAGEEVLLHWTNKDQYYTKSGEHFSNYRFKLPDMAGNAGKSVFFKLVSADTAKDNRKDNEAKRAFVLAEYRAAVWDDEGEVLHEEIVPMSANGDELTICFEYKAVDKKTKPTDLAAAAAEAILAHDAVQKDFAALATLAPTEKNPKRTLLDKHLADYTQKNSADYFIHKDLGGFLRRELDFYLKNEVLNLDDTGSAEALSGSLNQIRTLRRIAHDLIDFLAQLENFQKKLWEKKKLVTGVHYLVTLDHFFALPEGKEKDALLADVLANPAQREQWKNLFSVKELPPPPEYKFC